MQLWHNAIYGMSADGRTLEAMVRLGHLSEEGLHEHRELEYLRAAGRARHKRGRPRHQGKHLQRAEKRWDKLQHTP
jgi:hypothetical protein